MPRVAIVNLEKEIEIKHGESLLEGLLREDIEIEGYCGGFGYCGKCVVQVLSGRCSEPTSLEKKHLEKRLQDGFRLACQAKPEEDIRIDVSLSLTGAVHIHIETKEAIAEDLPLWREEVVVQKPSLEKVRALQELVEEALHPPRHDAEWSREAVGGISQIGEEDNVRLEVIGNGRRVRWAGKLEGQKEFLGLAVDIGTTTVAVELVNMMTGHTLYRAGAMNKQGRFGADVISRMKAVQENPAFLEQLRKLLVETVNELVKESCRKAECDPQRIFAVSIAGNTVMQHLFMGVSPLSIGVAPYVPVWTREYLYSAQEAGLQLNPAAEVYLFPAVAGYVGGDIVSGVTAHELEKVQEVLLYLDIGTNGEIVLIHDGRILCCGTAAGPAFEGAQIKYGSRASAGAISAVESDHGGLTVYTIGDVSPRSICGTGLIDTLACLVREKLISPTGRLTENTGSFAERIGQNEDGRFFILSEDPLITLSQEDISQLQLAKAAFQAGRRILLHIAGLEEKDIQRVILAGAFGSFIHPESAAVIGLVPPDGKVVTVGNASLFGAKRALLSTVFRERAADVSRRAEYVELSGRADFQEYFFDALSFPQ